MSEEDARSPRRAIRLRTQSLARYRAAPEVVWDLIVRAESMRAYLPHIAATRYFRGVEGEAGSMRYEVVVSDGRPARSRAVEILASERPERVVQRSDHGVLERTDVIRLVRDGDWTRVEQIGFAVSPHPLPRTLARIHFIAPQIRDQLEESDREEREGINGAVAHAANRLEVARDSEWLSISTPRVSRGALRYEVENETIFDARIELVWRAETDTTLQLEHSKNLHACEVIVSGAAGAPTAVVQVFTADWGHISSSFQVFAEWLPPRRYSLVGKGHHIGVTTTRTFEPLGERTNCFQTVAVELGLGPASWVSKGSILRRNREIIAGAFQRDAEVVNAILKALQE